MARIEGWLEAERDQLALWVPIALGVGIAAWFGLPEPHWWVLFLTVALGVGGLTLALGIKGRAVRALAIFLLFAGLGCGLAWLRSERVAAPKLGRPVIAAVAGRIVEVDPLPARGKIRLVVALDPGPGLPPKARINLDQQGAPSGLLPGARIATRVRLEPPPGPPLPGAYDFAKVAWFQGIGATGKAMGVVTVTPPPPGSGGFMRWLAGRQLALTHHIQQRLAGSEGGVAAAFVTGDVGAISDDDNNAFRRSGLAHLLSISGLHVTAVVAATMFLVLRLLALSRWLALRANLLLIAAAAGALAGIAYTLLSGAQVPTVRSCVAALLVLGGIALGREAMTLRMVAAGALIVLLFRPEALVGPSFQLSFAAVTAIIAFHEHPKLRALLLKRDEGVGRKLLRELAGLLATGILVEAALAPIAIYHFHRAGFYGALANIVAIPLTTFVIMPLEALALLFDIAGVGAPFWWLAGKGLTFLLWMARTVSALPGAVASLPSMPLGAFLLMVGGGLWVALWRTRMRRLGIVPFVIGAVWALLTPPPDLLITGDGKHLAVRTPDGALHLLRPRAKDYVRQQFAEGSGVLATALDLDDLPGARCTRDVCVAALNRGGRNWHILATRSPYRLDLVQFQKACAWADIAVSDRWLPRTCTPRWLKLDTKELAQTGGIAIDLSHADVRTVNGDDHHPWIKTGAPLGAAYSGKSNKGPATAGAGGNKQ
ncbi:MAG TPA: ComEC/Rec2 family competence protein [Sphingomonas sp.]|uniref:ComEC/Rec2 family competence protein n=1 Tax=Sphingomonas sp. TaxID=28214 RepID=UPI002C6BA13A|nr:ComEC/Rec2 family competence protein [Sphingomonas sp.]HMI20951.1 ComEC/Rec2 family competence protein [Sphingomonas sp.]